MNLFGRRRSKPRGAPASKDPAQTIVSLRGTLDTLEKRQAHLDKQIAKQVAEAKAKMAKKDKRGALFCLKKKKMYEAEIEEKRRAPLESQIMALRAPTADEIGSRLTDLRTGRRRRQRRRRPDGRSLGRREGTVTNAAIPSRR